jgi:hypothetical protein
MGLLLFFVNPTTARIKTGAAVAGTTGAGASASVFVERNFGRAGLVGRGARTTAPITATTARRYPDLSYQVAFASEPLSTSPAWVDMSTRMRAFTSKRGRSYEFDRMETGTSSVELGNRDAALSPENTASPYNPIRSTRPVRSFLQWESSYPLFRGISEGFPQNYISLGKDAVVELQANDLFYALNNSRFPLGSTTLTVALEAVTSGTEETISVDSTALPMPQAVPFTITVAGFTHEWPTEDMEVLEIVSATQYRVLRSAATTYEHPMNPASAEGPPVSTGTVSFGEALSGERIRQVLEAVGFDSDWYDLDEGQSLIAPSEDLANVAPLEHINLITEAEFGRFFVSRAGLFTFRDRHAVIVDNLAPVLIFRDETLPTATNEVPYTLDSPLEHSEEKLYNRVRITIQGGDYDGQIVDVADQSSIDEHFERVFERTFPYALLNDAESAAQFVLSRNSEDTLRLPAITVYGVKNPSAYWPLLLAREIGERARFYYQPEGGGSEIVKDLVIEGITHRIAPLEHEVTFSCTEVDATRYWILGRADYSELGTSTRVGF